MQKIKGHPYLSSIMKHHKSKLLPGVSLRGKVDKIVNQLEGVVGAIKKSTPDIAQDVVMSQRPPTYMQVYRRIEEESFNLQPSQIEAAAIIILKFVLEWEGDWETMMTSSPETTPSPPEGTTSPTRGTSPSATTPTSLAPRISDWHPLTTPSPPPQFDPSSSEEELGQEPGGGEVASPRPPISEGSRSPNSSEATGTRAFDGSGTGSDSMPGLTSSSDSEGVEEARKGKRDSESLDETDPLSEAVPGTGNKRSKGFEGTAEEDWLNPFVLSEQEQEEDRKEAALRQQEDANAAAVKQASVLRVDRDRTLRLADRQRVETLRNMFVGRKRMGINRNPKDTAEDVHYKRLCRVVRALQQEAKEKHHDWLEGRCSRKTYIMATQDLEISLRVETEYREAMRLNWLQTNRPGIPRQGREVGPSDHLQTEEGRLLSERFFRIERTWEALQRDQERLEVDRSPEADMTRKILAEDLRICYTAMGNTQDMSVITNADFHELRRQKQRMQQDEATHNCRVAKRRQGMSCMQGGIWRYIDDMGIQRSCNNREEQTGSSGTATPGANTRGRATRRGFTKPPPLTLGAPPSNHNQSIKEEGAEGVGNTPTTSGPPPLTRMGSTRDCRPTTIGWRPDARLKTWYPADSTGLSTGPRSPQDQLEPHQPIQDRGEDPVLVIDLGEPEQEPEAVMDQPSAPVEQTAPVPGTSKAPSLVSLQRWVTGWRPDVVDWLKGRPGACKTCGALSHASEQCQLERVFSTSVARMNRMTRVNYE